MTEEYNHGLVNGEVPDERLYYFLVPLPKTGKEKNKLNGDRIIILQNVNDKVFENIIPRPISAFIETR